jgi:hypothetical protein
MPGELVLGITWGVPGRIDCFELLGEGAATSVEGGGRDVSTAVRSASFVSISNQLSKHKINMKAVLTCVDVGLVLLLPLVAHL